MELAIGLLLLLGVYLYGVRVGVKGTRDRAIEHGRAQADSEWSAMLENGMV